MRNILFAAIACVAVSGCTSVATPTAPSDFMNGYSALKRADYASAERSLTSALAANPSDPYANLSMGSVMHSTNRPALARRYYETAIANGENTYGNRTYSAGRETMIPTGTARSVADLARQNLARL